MKKVAVIFAGGVGQRMGSDIPKQFLEVYGKPILIHTLDRFQYHNEIDEIYVGCNGDYIDYCKKVVNKYNIDKIPQNGIIEGGKSGLDTIYRILKQVDNDHKGEQVIVLIHDGVRPIINKEVISANIECVKRYGNAITCTSAFETPIISVDGISINQTLNRNSVYTAQAPQSFYLEDILMAHETIRNSCPNYDDPRIVDSCTLVNSVGIKTHIVEGNRGNIKVTTVSDYIELLAHFTSNDYINIFDIEKSKAKEKMKNYE